MFIGQEEIATPLDSPHAYSTLWRHECAAAIWREGVAHPLLADDYVFAQVQYLRLSATGAAAAVDAAAAFSPGDARMLQVARANAIFQTANNGSFTAARIEAMLLCPELTYADIALEFGLEVDTVKTFERLFYNVRDDEGKLLGCKGFLIYCALKGATSIQVNADRAATDAMYWRVLAFESGYKMLYSIWGFRFDRMPGLSEVDFHMETMRNLFRLLDRTFRYSERVSLRDISNLVGTMSERFAEMRKSGILSEKGAIDSDSMMLSVIGLLTPGRLIEGEARKAELARELQDKIASVKLREQVQDGGVPDAFAKLQAQLDARNPGQQ